MREHGLSLTRIFQYKDGIIDAAAVHVVAISDVVHPNSSVIRQKGKSQNGGNKKTKHAKFSEKRTFLTP